MSGAGESPQLRLRLPASVHAMLTEQAAAEGKPPSELARELLTDALLVRIGNPKLARLEGPLGRRVRLHRMDVLRHAEAVGVTNLRVFGSVARSEDTLSSDIDLLVDLPEGIGLFALARLEGELEELLGAPVDLVPAASLKNGIHVADAVAL